MLLFPRDDVNLNQLNNRLKLVLVDHNILPHSDSYLTDSIVQIIDHHKKECSSLLLDLERHLFRMWTE